LRVERPAPLLQPGDESNRYGIQLYHRVLADTDLRGRDVLEVSCGRGGACSYIARYCGPRQVTGIDLASRAVAFCRKHHRYRGLRFITGDSERLPVPRSSIDVVVNVEASHCYPSGERFLAEVRRVLRPGGRLLLADLRPAVQVPAWREQIVAAGFQVIEHEELTAGIVAALDRTTPSTLESIRRGVPAPLRAIVREFAGVQGSPVYDLLRDGGLEYHRFVLQ
jgi:SAM-dependent methyltransferase